MTELFKTKAEAERAIEEKELRDDYPDLWVVQTRSGRGRWVILGAGTGWGYVPGYNDYDPIVVWTGSRVYEDTFKSLWRWNKPLFREICEPLFEGKPPGPETPAATQEQAPVPVATPIKPPFEEDEELCAVSMLDKDEGDQDGDRQVGNVLYPAVFQK